MHQGRKSCQGCSVASRAEGTNVGAGGQKQCPYGTLPDCQNPTGLSSSPGAKVKHRITRIDGELFGFAGHWPPATRHPPPACWSEDERSWTILTAVGRPPSLTMCASAASGAVRFEGGARRVSSDRVEWSEARDFPFTRPNLVGQTRHVFAAHTAGRISRPRLPVAAPAPARVRLPMAGRSRYGSRLRLVLPWMLD